VLADDASDLCYVKDCARGIALLQLARGVADYSAWLRAGHEL
jgi:hypothetical protein